MLGMLAVSFLFAVLGLFGLVVAAAADDDATRFMGMGLTVFMWFLLVGYHGRRAERRARASDGP